MRNLYLEIEKEQNLLESQILQGVKIKSRQMRYLKKLKKKQYQENQKGA